MARQRRRKQRKRNRKQTSTPKSGQTFHPQQTTQSDSAAARAYPSSFAWCKQYWTKLKRAVGSVLGPQNTTFKLPGSIYPNNKVPWQAHATSNPAAIEIDGYIYVFYRAVGQPTAVDGKLVRPSSFGFIKINADGKIVSRSKRPVYYNATYYQQHETYSHGDKPGISTAGFEDPRLIRIDDTIYMIYTHFDGVHHPRVAMTSMRVKDFVKRSWDKWKAPVYLSSPDSINKNWVLFPEKINGKYVLVTSISPEVLIAYVDDLNHIGEGEIQSTFYSSGRKTHWDEWRHGAAAPPVRTSEGWLLLYHAEKRSRSEKRNQYVLGAMLLDINDPTKVLYRSPCALLQPDKREAKGSHSPHVIYANGVVVIDGVLHVYYGAGEKTVHVAKMPLQTLLDEMKQAKQTLTVGRLPQRLCQLTGYLPEQIKQEEKAVAIAEIWSLCQEQLDNIQASYNDVVTAIHELLLKEGQRSKKPAIKKLLTDISKIGPNRPNAAVALVKLFVNPLLNNKAIVAELIDLTFALFKHDVRVDACTLLTEMATAALDQNGPLHYQDRRSPFYHNRRTAVKSSIRYFLRQFTRLEEIAEASFIKKAFFKKDITPLIKLIMEGNDVDNLPLAKLEQMLNLVKLTGAFLTARLYSELSTSKNERGFRRNFYATDVSIEQEKYLDVIATLQNSGIPEANPYYHDILRICYNSLSELRGNLAPDTAIKYRFRGRREGLIREYYLKKLTRADYQWPQAIIVKSKLIPEDYDTVLYRIMTARLVAKQAHEEGREDFAHERESFARDIFESFMANDNHDPVYKEQFSDLFSEYQLEPPKCPVDPTTNTDQPETVVSQSARSPVSTGFAEAVELRPIQSLQFTSGFQAFLPDDIAQANNRTAINAKRSIPFGMEGNGAQFGGPMPSKVISFTWAWGQPYPHPVTGVTVHHLAVSTPNPSGQPQEIGSMDFYGERWPCVSEDGSRHNIVNTQGFCEAFDPRRDLASLKHICEVLPPNTMDKILMQAPVSAGYGIQRGVSTVISKVINKRIISKRFGAVWWAPGLLRRTCDYSTFFGCRLFANSNEATWAATLYLSAVDTGSYVLVSEAASAFSNALAAVAHKMESPLGVLLSRYGVMAAQTLHGAVSTDPTMAVTGLVAGVGAQVGTEEIAKRVLGP